MNRTANASGDSRTSTKQGIAQFKRFFNGCNLSSDLTKLMQTLNCIPYCTKDKLKTG